MSKRESIEYRILPVLAAWVGVAAAVWVVASHFEARAFNRATGADVSTWDAMFVELRVNSSPKGSD
jgi:hypothetical protein